MRNFERVTSIPIWSIQTWKCYDSLPLNIQHLVSRVGWKPVSGGREVLNSGGWGGGGGEEQVMSHNLSQPFLCTQNIAHGRVVARL